MRSILLMLAAMVSAACTAEASPKLNRERAAMISGVIQGTGLTSVGEALDKYASESSKPIDLIINSPGGSIVPGFFFINKMEDLRAQGIKFNCFVPEVAASMAFQILLHLHCDERYVLDRSFLLWHRVRVYVGGMFGAPMTAPQAEYLATSLQAVDDVILSELKDVLGRDLSGAQINYHFENETLHVGQNLGRMAPRAFQSVKQVDGLYEAIQDEKLPRSGTPRDPEDIYVPEQGTIVYISSNPDVNRLGNKLDVTEITRIRTTGGK